jgi:hypothetical protein
VLGRMGGVAGGILGYVAGLFFKSLITVLITLKVPAFDQYLISTFVPAGGLSTPHFIEFITVPLPFALMGAALGLLAFRSNQGRLASAATES